MKNLILGIGLIGGLIGCGGESKNVVEKYRGDMERFIDSMSNDFESYEFIDMGVDSLLFSEFYGYMIDSSIDENGRYKGINYELYKESEKDYYNCLNKKKLYGYEFIDCDFEKEHYEEWKSEFFYSYNKLNRIIQGIEYDSCNEVYYYINYKIRNENNGLEKKSCVYIVNSEGKIKNKKIDKGYFVKWYE